MNDIRYKDRKYLNLYDLDVELFNRFNLEVYDVIPIRKVFILCTKTGEKILKRIDYDLKELEFITSALKYINEHGFNRVINFIPTIDNKYYTEWNNDIYCIMDLIDGRECQYSNPIDITITAKGLGELHDASKDFVPNLEYKNNTHKLIKKLEYRLDKIKLYKSIAKMYKNKNEFDILFLKNVDYYIEQINTSILILKDSDYHNICNEKDKVALCHHDLAYHNVLIKDEKAYFIDFDYSILDLKMHDLCNLINKVIKNFAFDVNKTKLIINNYCESNSIDQRELKVLYGMLNFPEDFYSISRDYYEKKKDWGEEAYLRKLIRKCDYKLDREQFLDDFKEYYNI